MHQIAVFDFHFCKKIPGGGPPDPHQWEGETPSHAYPCAALPRRIASRCYCLPLLSEDLPLLSHIGKTLSIVELDLFLTISKNCIISIDFKQDIQINWHDVEMSVCPMPGAKRPLAWGKAPTHGCFAPY